MEYEAWNCHAGSLPLLQFCSPPEFFQGIEGSLHINNCLFRRNLNQKDPFTVSKKQMSWRFQLVTFRWLEVMNDITEVIAFCWKSSLIPCHDSSQKSYYLTKLSKNSYVAGTQFLWSCFLVHNFVTKSFWQGISKETSRNAILHHMEIFNGSSFFFHNIVRNYWWSPSPCFTLIIRTFSEQSNIHDDMLSTPHNTPISFHKLLMDIHGVMFKKT